MALDPNLTTDDRRRIVLAQIYTQRPGMPTHFARELSTAIELGGDRRVIDSLIDRMREDETIRGMPAPTKAKYPLDGRYRLNVGGETINVRVKTDRRLFAPRVYVDAPRGPEIYDRTTNATVRAMLDDPGARYDALIAYGRDTDMCGRCGRALKTATSLARGLGDECAAADDIAALFADTEEPAPTHPRYRVTFNRVGRSSQGVLAPVEITAADADDVARQLTPVILPRMRSMNVDIVVDLDAGTGQILAGFNNGGSFTIETITTDTETTR